MATITPTTATLKIPAAYLADVRSALEREIQLGGESFMTDNDADQPSNLLMLDRDLALYRQILDATGEVTITADHDMTSAPINHVLDQTVRLIAARLETEKQYGPIQMSAIGDIADELAWVAREAARISRKEA